MHIEGFCIPVSPASLMVSSIILKPAEWMYKNTVHVLNFENLIKQSFRVEWG